MAAHRYWRVSVTSTAEGDGETQIAEIGFLDTVGGSTSTGGGNAISSPSYSGAAAAFDGVFDNLGWGSSTYNVWPQWVGYDFIIQIEILQVDIYASAFNPSSSPGDYTIESSDNGTDWLVEFTISGAAPWSSSELRSHVIGTPAALVGAATVNIQNEVYGVGVAGAAVRNDVFDLGAASLNIENVIYNLDSSSVAIKNKVYSAGVADVGLQSVIARSGVDTASISIRNEVFGVAQAALNIENRINEFTQAGQTSGGYWRAIVSLGGVDMSARIYGAVSVDETEDGARLADFTLLPFSGAIDPYDWIGQSVVIEYAEYNSQGAQQGIDRLFTGIVEEPVYDPVSGLTDFACTDKLQEFLEQQSKAQLDALISGYHSVDIFGETDDLWDYAQQRISTQAISFNLNEYGNFRATPWESGGGKTFGMDSIVHETIALSLIKRRDVTNSININFSYRYARKWQRELSGGWNYPRPFYQYLSEATSLPNRAMVLSALNTGWDIKAISWQKLPPTGQYSNAEGAQTTWGISDELRDSLVFGFSFSASKRWLQDVTEQYSIQVTAPASIEQHGVITNDVNHSIDAPVDDDFERQAQAQTVGISSYSDDSETGEGYGYQPPEVGSTKINDSDYIADPASRDAFDNAVNTAIAQARTRILSSHRSNVAIINTLINSSVNTSKTITIDHDKITAKGKVRRVQHVLNTLTGSAISTIEVALYQPNIAGQGNDAIEPPEAVYSIPDLTTDSLALNSHFGGKTTVQYSPDWTGYIGNWDSREFPSEWYPNEFRVDLPAAQNLARDAQIITPDEPVKYLVAIPQDTLNITA